MRNGSRLLLAVPGVLIATALSAPAGAASFRLSPWSEFNFSARAWAAQPEGAMTPVGHRFNWSAARLFDDSAIFAQSNVNQFARHVHFQRFRLLGINGSAPFPMAAFEIGSKNRFFGNKLLIQADVFRYRYGGYRLTLPGGRAYNGVAAVLPSLGMSSRTSGAELQAAYKLSSGDFAGINASYAYGRRASLMSLAAPSRQITEVSSLQIVPSYEHLVPLARGRSLAFDAEAIYRSAQRTLVGSLDPAVRTSQTTRFDASLTYRSGPRLAVSAFVRNITDVHPDRSATLTTRNLVNPATVSTMLSEPRTYGLAFSARL